MFQEAGTPGQDLERMTHGLPLSQRETSHHHHHLNHHNHKSIENKLPAPTTAPEAEADQEITVLIRHSYLNRLILTTSLFPLRLCRLTPLILTTKVSMMTWTKAALMTEVEQGFILDLPRGEPAQRSHLSH